MSPAALSEWTLNTSCTGAGIRYILTTMNTEVYQADTTQVLRDVKALDMEASAFLQVCNHMDIHAFGIIKGVSDKGDAARTGDKTKVWLQAMTNAANALKEYLEWKLEHDPPGPADLGKLSVFNSISKQLIRDVQIDS